MEQRLRIFSKELHDELVNILDYWQKNTIDYAHGGFYGQVDHFNRIVPKASKGAVLNARILWTFSSAYRNTGNSNYLEIAHRAFEYIKHHFLDPENRGLYWEVDYSGKPINTRKQTYAQGFGIYGFSEYFKASAKTESLELAIKLYEDIESHCFDAKYGGYIEALSEEWKPLEDMRLSPRDENYPKSMNTHLHILEPYANLYRVWPDPILAGQIKKLIRIFLDHIIDKSSGHFNLFFENDWKVKSEIISFGHEIEGVWLLTDAAEVLGEKEISDEVKTAALKMTDATMAEGLASDGSIYYEKDISNTKIDRERHWWPQAEAIVGFLNAYQISRGEQYLKSSMNAWGYIKNHLIDRKNGEWYWSVNDRGIPSSNNDKAGFWKCPYHNSRACMESLQRLKLIARLWK